MLLSQRDRQEVERVKRELIGVMSGELELVSSTLAQTSKTHVREQTKLHFSLILDKLQQTVQDSVLKVAEGLHKRVEALI